MNSIELNGPYGYLRNLKYEKVVLYQYRSPWLTNSVKEVLGKEDSRSSIEKILME